MKTKLGGEDVLLVASCKREGKVLKRPQILRVPSVGSDADGLRAEKRHRRDVRPQLDLVSSCLLYSPCDLLCEPRKKKSHEWIFDDDAQLLGSRLMPVTCGLRCLARCALGLQ